MRSRIAIIAAMLGLFGAAGEAVAGTYYRAAEATNFVTYIDWESLSRAGDVITYWQVLIHYGPQTYDTKKYYWYVVNRTELNCAKEERRIIATVAYTRTHELVTSASYPSYTPWQLIVPETVGDSEARVLCGKDRFDGSRMISASRLDVVEGVWK
jgi:hypothetical protein